MSVDGFVAGPAGEMDWMTWNWDPKLADYVTRLTEPVDTILMGRKMTGGFMGHWQAVLNDPKDASYNFARKMVDTQKVVFTRELERSEWVNTTLAKGDITEEVNALKRQKGGDMIVYGGAGFVTSLVKAGLIDEYHLFINPCILGKGLPIFAEADPYIKLKRLDMQSFDCGITVLVYGPLQPGAHP